MNGAGFFFLRMMNAVGTATARDVEVQKQLIHHVDAELQLARDELARRKAALATFDAQRGVPPPNETRAANARRVDGHAAAESMLCAQGFVHLRGALDARMVADLDAHISQTEIASRREGPTAEHESRSLLPPTLEPRQRSDILLTLEPPVTTALFAALCEYGLATLLQARLGSDALLWELSAMRSRPGAIHARVHACMPMCNVHACPYACMPMCTHAQTRACQVPIRKHAHTHACPGARHAHTHACPYACMPCARMPMCTHAHVHRCQAAAAPPRHQVAARGAFRPRRLDRNVRE